MTTDNSPDSISAKQERPSPGAAGSPGGSGDGQDKSLTEVLAKTGTALQEGVQEEGRRLAGAATQQADNLAQRGKGGAAEILDVLSEAASEASQRLEERGYDTGSRLTRVLSEQTGSLAEEIHGRSTKEILQEAGDLAKRHPALAIGAGLIAGFALVRFLTVSESGSEDRKVANG